MYVKYDGKIIRTKNTKEITVTVIQVKKNRARN